jgi:RNA polymerase subunit RPABC4/transcription elongation factor Spt4
LRQAEDYRELDTSTLNQFYKLLQVIFRTHPFPALRAKEIDAWARSTEYQNIMDGIYPRLDMDFYQGPGGNDFGSGRGPSGPPFTPPYTSPGGPPPGYSPGGAMTTCPNCDAAVEATATFCHMCGSTIVGAIAVIEKPPAGEARKTIDVQATTSPSSTTSASPKPDTKPRCHTCGTVIKRTDEYCPSCGLNTRMDW